VCGKDVVVTEVVESMDDRNVAKLQARERTHQIVDFAPGSRTARFTGRSILRPGKEGQEPSRQLVHMRRRFSASIFLAMSASMHSARLRNFDGHQVADGKLSHRADGETPLAHSVRTDQIQELFDVVPAVARPEKPRCCSRSR